MSVSPFDLIPIVNSVPCKIESIDIWGNNIYIGTNDGQILLYILEKVEQNRKISFKSKLEKKRSLGHGKKPIEKIILIADIGKLISLCDGNLDVLNLYNLEPSTSIGLAGKGVTTFCIKKKSPEYKLCILSKKKLSFFEFVGVFELYKEVFLQEAPITIEWCHNTLCLGYKKEYAVLDIDNEFHKVLFPLEKNSTPKTKLITDQSKFLLTTDDLAIFVNLQGEPVQGAIKWNATPVSMAYYEPYLITILSNKSIEIQDIASEKIVQQITKPPASFHQVCEGRGSGKDFVILYSSNPNAVYCLHFSNLDDIVQSYIANGEHKEAIRLFEIFFKRDRGVASDYEDPEQEKQIYQQRIGKIYEQIAMTEFYKLHFKAAFPYLEKSNIDPRTIITFFPSLLPYQTDFRSQLSTTESIYQIIETTQSATDKQGLSAEAKLELMNYIENRLPLYKDGTDVLKDLVSVFLKLLVDHNKAEKFVTNITRYHNQYYTQDLEEWLQQRQFFSELGIVYQYSEKYRKALTLWCRLYNNELTDAHGSSGIDESIALLEARPTAIPEPPKELVWEFSTYFLENYPDKAIHIFLKTRKDALAIDQVIDFLQPTGVKLYQQYLEYIIFDQQNRAEYLHTRLATSYIDTIFQQNPELQVSAKKNEIPQPDDNRQKLIDLLEFSNCYNAGSLLHRIRSSLLYEELVILYLRMGQYEMMFNIIVWKLHDFKKAEFICANFDPKSSLSTHHLKETNTNIPATSSTGRPKSVYGLSPSSISPTLYGSSADKNTGAYLHSRDSLSLNNAANSDKEESNTGLNLKEGLYDLKRQELFLCLLKTYLNYKQHQLIAANRDVGTTTVVPTYIIEFLNNYYTEMDPIKVIQLLPESIQLHGGISEYLIKSFNYSISQQRESKIVKSLQKSLNFQTKSEYMRVCSSSILIGSEKRCPVCSKPIGDRVFVYFPNGTVVHFKCFQIPYICPVSGRNFKNDPIDYPNSV
ncbi:hypothetical protein CYY_004053 [Polysphondylium violaceum]|uniref:CNH domain-containing protein n=1 Tax=Polysphondylium violaceum TaxID=133409 RepID=A0A8J4PTW2_9MYCE|nr:hypothetical protein CYY_004053 [Polysphondylium violaceum]